MKSLIAVILATAVAACGGAAGTGTHGAPVSVNFYGGLPFNQLTGATIDVFGAADGTSQVGSTITLQACPQPITASTTGCFDPGLYPATLGNTTLATAIPPAPQGGTGVTAINVASTANFVQYGMVTVGTGPNAETVEIASITDATHFVAATGVKKSHAVGDAVVLAIRPAKFYGYSLDLPGAAKPGKDYWITVKYFNGATQVGIDLLHNVKVISGQVNTLSLSTATTYTSANGVVITASTGFVTYLGLSAIQPMSITAIDPSSGGLTYAWSATNCTGSSFSPTNAAATNFGSPATATSSCKVTVTASSSTAGVPSATKSTTINVANDTVITPNAAPPQINQIAITSPNGKDATCTLTRAAPGCVGNACWPNVSCQAAFNVSATPLNAGNVFAAQSYFLNIAVQGNLGGSAFNPSAPPTVSAIVDCPNDKEDYPYTKPTDGSTPKANYSVSFPAGYELTGVTSTGNANQYGSDSYFPEPEFTYGKGAWDETEPYAANALVVAFGNIYQAQAANVGLNPAEGAPWVWVSSAAAIPTAYQTGAGTWATNASVTPVAWCTVTVKLTNQSGGSDSVPVGVYFQ